MKKIDCTCKTLCAMVCRDTALDITNPSDRPKIKAVALTVAKVAQAIALHYQDFGFSENQVEPFTYPATVLLPDQSYSDVMIDFTISTYTLTVVKIEMLEHDPRRV